MTAIDREFFHTQDDFELYETAYESRKTKNYEKLINLCTQLRNGKNMCRHEYFDYINLDEVEYAIDGGAYNGEHIILFKTNFKNIKNVHSFEPMWQKFKSTTIDNVIKNDIGITINELGLWSSKETLKFAQGGSGSHVSLNNSPESLVEIKTTSIDEYLKENNIEKIDYIKLDIEGAEPAALKGAVNTIKKYRPQIAVCLYHNLSDFIEIPLFFKENLKDYIYKVGHYSPTHLGTCLYAIPKEKYLGTCFSKEIAAEADIMSIICNKSDVQKALDTAAIKYKDKKVIIYGAGSYFEYISNHYSLEKLNIIAVSDLKFQNQKVDSSGITAISPCEIASLSPDVILMAVLDEYSVKKYLNEKMNCSQIKIESLLSAL